MCGGLIHPIAGKCKHCKIDLAGVRAARQAAPAALPQIIATNGAQRIEAPANGHNGHANGHTNGHNGHANGHAAGVVSNSYAPAGLAPSAGNSYAPPGLAASAGNNYAPAGTISAGAMSRAYEDGMSPVLPPRVSARMAAQAHGGTAWWKSWPLVVIVLAVLAIVTAVILMVWPPGKSAAADTKDNKGPPVAPERMETNPLPPAQPPAKSGDPWKDGQSNNGNKIDIPDDPDVPSSGKTKLTGTSAIMMEAAIHLCDRAVACGKNDVINFSSYCKKAKDDVTANYDLQPPTCAARTRCLASLDKIDCDGDITFDMDLVKNLSAKFGDCLLATTSC